MSGTIAVIGGGAAGIYAALAARSEGASVIIFERNARLGIKILISGGGKCNITHDATPGEIEKGFIRSESRFLRHALHELTSRDVIEALHGDGVATCTRDNGRVFPVSGKAEDVLAAFERRLHREHVDVRTNSRVSGIDVSGGEVKGVVVNGRHFACDAAVIATGGMSYRKVGTTGDGIEWSRLLGHSIAPVRAALAPIFFPAPPAPDWQGVALRDVVMSVEAQDAAARIRKMGISMKWRDDVLLTHRGLSGPATLEISRAAALAREFGATAHLEIDLVPDVDAAKLQDMWKSMLTASGRKEVQSFVELHVPRALVRYLLASSGLRAGIRMSDVDRSSRSSLISNLKRWQVGVVGEVPLDKGEVTAGGVALEEVDRITMESKRIRGLYIVGEALDIAGSIGGYNLQAAFATGWVAGRAAARRVSVKPDTRMPQSQA